MAEDTQAAAPGGHEAERRATRLGELRAMGTGELEALTQEMVAAQVLPRLRYHFQRHGRDLDARTPDEYRQLFLTHIRRTDLRRFTLIRPADESRMWYLIDVTSGAIAQYNQDRKRYWSFFRPTNVLKYLQSALGWSVEVCRTDRGWEFNLWER